MPLSLTLLVIGLSRCLFSYARSLPAELGPKESEGVGELSVTVFSHSACRP